MATKLDKATLRKVAQILKKQGIGKPLDSRKITEYDASTVRGGKSLKEWAKKLEPALDGKATLVSVSSTKDKGYRKLYEHTVTTDAKTGKKKEFYLIPHSADETVEVKDGKVTFTHPAGIERVQIPVEYHNLEQWFSEANQLEMKGKNYAFRFFGGSSRIFSNYLSAIDELEHYKSVQETFSGSRYEQREMFRNIEIVKVHSKRMWEKQKKENKAKRRKR